LSLNIYTYLNTEEYINKLENFKYLKDILPNMKKIERKLQEISKSLLLTLPSEWTKQFKLKKGSTVEVAVADDGALRSAPVL